MAFGDSGASGGRKKAIRKRTVEQKQRRSYAARPVSERQAQLATKGVLAPKYDKTVRTEHARRVTQLKTDPKARQRLVKRQERRAIEARQEVRRNLGKALGESVSKLKRLDEPKRNSVTDIPGNALREARDVVKGAPGIVKSVVDTAKAGTDVGISHVAGAVTPGRKRSVSKKSKAHLEGVKQSIQQEDPVYALGEGVVRAVKGDSKGARKSFTRAKDKAIERPLGAISTATVGGSVALRAGNNARLVVSKTKKAPTLKRMREQEAQARARPDKVVRDASQPRGHQDKRDLDKARQRAQERVQRRQQGEAVRTQTKPNEVKVKQTYSRGVVRRQIQRKREDRAIARGKDPLELRGKKARKAVARDFDRVARNVHAGGLAREQEVAERHKTHRKALGGDELKEAAVDLLTDKRVRRHKPKQDLRELYRTTLDKVEDGPDRQRNLKLYERLSSRLDIFEDPDVIRVAKEEIEGLNASERRLAQDKEHSDFFEGTDPEFVKKVRPHIARGEIEMRDGPPKTEGGGEAPSTPPPKPGRGAKVVAVVNGKKVETGQRAEPIEKAPRRVQDMSEAELRDKRNMEASARAHAPQPGMAKGTTGKPINKPPSPDAEKHARETAQAGTAVAKHNERVADLEASLAFVGQQIRDQTKVEKRVVPGKNGTRSAKAVRVPKDDKAATKLRALRNQENGLKAELATARRDRDIHSNRLHTLKETHGVKAETPSATSEVIDPAELRKAGMQSDPQALARGERDPRAVKLEAELDKVETAIKSNDELHAQLMAEDAFGNGASEFNKEAVAKEAKALGDKREKIVKRLDELEDAEVRAADTTIKTDASLGQGGGRPVVERREAVEAPEPKGRVEARGSDTAIHKDGEPVRKGMYWTKGPRAGQKVEASHFDRQTEGAFIRGVKDDVERNVDPNLPQAGKGHSAQDLLEGKVGAGRRQQTALERERLITIKRMNEALEHRMAYKTDGGETRFDPARGEKIAEQLSSKGDEWTTKRIGDKSGQVFVVRKVVADRWTQQFAEPGRLERAGNIITRKFIRTVLPFSATWHLGNVVDLWTRLAIEDARQSFTGKAEVIRALDDAMAIENPHLAKELQATYRAHFGSRETIHVPTWEDVSPKLSFLTNGLGEAWGIRQARGGLDKVTDSLLNVGSATEGRLVRGAANAAAKKLGREMGLDVKDHVALGQRLAQEFKADPDLLLEFQRRTLEITGDYITKSARERKLINMGVPFYKWMRAANGFVFKTLPAKHPMKVAFALWAGTLTAPQRAQLGLNYYITEDEAFAKGLPQLKQGFMAGAIPLGNGMSIPTVPFTSIGEAGRWAGAAGELAGVSDGIGVDSDVGETATGIPLIVGRAGEKAYKATRDTAGQPGVAFVNQAVEAVQPGLKQVRRYREVTEHGIASKPSSTAFAPKAFGKKGTKSAAVGAAFSAPAPSEQFQNKKRKKLAKRKAEEADRQAIREMSEKEYKDRIALAAHDRRINTINEPGIRSEARAKLLKRKR